MIDKATELISASRAVSFTTSRQVNGTTAANSALDTEYMLYA